MAVVCSEAVRVVVSPYINKMAHMLVKDMTEARWLVRSSPAPGRELALLCDVGVEVPQDERENITTLRSRPADVAQHTLSSRDSQVGVEVQVRDHDGALR